MYTIRRSGFNTLDADTVKRALEILEHEVVDVVVTDVHLPDGNGVELPNSSSSLAWPSRS